jgi:hypothetical protein
LDPTEISDQQLEGNADGDQYGGTSGRGRLAPPRHHAAKGISDKDFELAKKIEGVVQWQPGKEAGALEGTPHDQRFAYLKYDD